MCDIGVRQGENLSPLLIATCLIVIDFEYSVIRGYDGQKSLSNDIRNNLSDSDVEVSLRLYVLLYADGTIVPKTPAPKDRVNKEPEELKVHNLPTNHVQDPHCNHQRENLHLPRQGQPPTSRTERM